MTVARSKTGERNMKLTHKSWELIRCGINPRVLVRPALGAGLLIDEVISTIAKAERCFDETTGQDTLTVALAWAERWHSKLHVRLHPILHELVATAVAQNSLSPMVVQERLLHIAPKTTVNRWLGKLCEAGALVKKPMGRRPNGLTRSNVYRLVEESEPLAGPAFL